MMSRRLCGVLAAEALALLLLIDVMVGREAPTPWTALGACVALVPLNVFTVIVAYVAARWYGATSAPAASGGRARAWRCTLGELLALFAAFVVIQPFERWWMGREAVGRVAPGRVPVLLVHGYLCNRGLWWWLRRRLRARHFAVATVDLEPPLAGLDELAARLAERVESVLVETGAAQVVLVTHSMGGLVSRAYLRAHGTSRVAGMVTLAAPHHGTRLARLGWGRNARELRPGSAWLRSLNAQPVPAIPLRSVWTPDDEMLAPPDTARLPGVRETILAGLGHVAMVFSPRVLACLEAELTCD